MHCYYEKIVRAGGSAPGP